MSIPASDIVKVLPRVVQAGSETLQINGLVLTKETNVSAGLHIFTNANDVAEIYGTNSDMYNGAVIYFKGFDNSFKKPIVLYTYNIIDETITIPATHATLTSGNFNNINKQDVLAQQGTKIIITINGTEYTSNPLDFSGLSSDFTIEQLYSVIVNALSNIPNAANLFELNIVDDNKFEFKTVLTGSGANIKIDDPATETITIPATSAALTSGSFNNINWSETGGGKTGYLQFIINGTGYISNELSFNNIDPIEYTFSDYTDEITTAIADIVSQVAQQNDDFTFTTTADGKLVFTTVETGAETSFEIHGCDNMGNPVPESDDMTLFLLLSGPSATIVDGQDEHQETITSRGAETMLLTTPPAIKVDGQDEHQETITKSLTEVLNDILNVEQNWVTFTTSWELDDDQIIELRTWSASFGNRFWAVNWVKENELFYNTQSSGHIADKLKQANLGAGNLVIPDLNIAMFEMGTAASVNYNANTPGRGKITYMFKSQEGITPFITEENKAQALNYWKISFYGDWATAKSQFKFFAYANTFGNYPFIDTAIDAIWLNNYLQSSLMDLLKSALALPYNEEGFSRIRSVIIGQDGPVYRAILNGVIRPGVDLSKAQEDQVDIEAGMNIHEIIENNGYYLQVIAPSAIDRQNRLSPEINLWYTDGGAIHKIEMNSTVIL